jgi:hypothetical protein
MANFYVIEVKFPDDDVWIEPSRLHIRTVNVFKTLDDAWLCVHELHGVDDWANAEYRIALYAGQDDHEEVQTYYHY